MKASLYVLTLIIVFILLSLWEIPVLLKKKEWKELFVVVCLLSIGFILNILLIIGMKLPDPNQMITSLIKSVLNLISQ
ncbi:MAG: hypothetical protein P4L69_10245 [Desulfosporosinus sp.]|nr:hypothetical protein [Desulfosporosinus sp.]